MVDHPMHLHGFYFTVDMEGDTQTDTPIAPADRREVVTAMMEELSSMRMRWVPEREGNWLFHCHLVRHAGELQRFQVERERAPAGATMDPDMDMDMDMDGMAGMILGITVLAGSEPDPPDPEPVRRIDLWTGARPGVFEGGAPELGFVVQEGPEAPAPDSVVVPGSPLVLIRDEPTEIVVHNRLEIPLSVHWHGLELRSLYDGVGHWSGRPGSVRPPIEPGGTQRVVLAPPRAGTFFYHTHGEPGHELAQGLYGAFLVFDPGETWDRDADRIFVLGARGAGLDAPPAVNGRIEPEAQRFVAGYPYRLRFLHISPDAFKRVRLLRDGEPVDWTPRAKDGADLPATQRRAVPAEVGIGVGEAFDFEWTPRTDGVYVLEVRTEFYPSRGGSAVQRVAFGVGPVSDEDLTRATRGAARGVELSAAERAAYVGTWAGRLLAGDDARTWLLGVWEVEGRLYMAMAPRGEIDLEPPYMVPLGAGAFSPGTWEDGLVTRVLDDVRLHFQGDTVQVLVGGDPAFRFERTGSLVLTPDERRRLEGSYGSDAVPFQIEIRTGDAGLEAQVTGQPTVRLRAVAFGHFMVEGDGVPPGTVMTFELDDGTARSLVIAGPGQPPLRLNRR
jgi:hypothetical protein